MATNAIAGPSSSPGSSPVVPAGARNLRVNKRVINLVNPADPNDFSAQSMSPNVSADLSNSGSKQRGERESTPQLQIQIENASSFTPMGVDRNGVKGILRPSGTPGSGNGVRFFPKNRFRVITPNQSLAKPPPSPTSNSFLSQLLAVTIPSMSPRRNPPPPAVPDESWEVPGQEGEISLVASSVASRDYSLQEIQEEEEEDTSHSRDRWDGVPETHSSPLGLPPSELPSLEMRVPEDMSNLLSQQFSSVGMDSDSFSASEFQADTRADESSRSVGTDENPTIRRALPPLEEKEDIGEQHVKENSESVDDDKPTESIFADMSAEQAELSWPLTRPRSDVQKEDDEDTRFHSMVDPDPSDYAASPLPRPSRASSTAPNPRTQTVDSTQFFDCTSSSLSQSLTLSPTPMPVLVHSSDSTSSLATSRNTPSPLLRPTKDLFDAHNSLATSLRAELELYKTLAGKLHAEVSERDNALGELNLRCLEGEGWRVQLEAAQAEVSRLKARQPQSPMLLGLRASPNNMSSPTPMRRTTSADRTTVAESEQRDLEIRLAKITSEQSALVKQIEQERVERERLKLRLEEAERRASEMDQEERDGQVKRQREVEERDERETDALKRLEDMEYQLSEVREDLEEAKHQREEAMEDVEALRSKLHDTEDKAEDLQHRLDGTLHELEDTRHELADMQHERDTAEEEIHRLKEDAIELQNSLRHGEETTRRLDEVERQLESERYHRQEAERGYAEAKSDKEHLEAEINQLREELRTARAEIALGSITTTPDEVRRLRAESASKDLEIVKLQRRKAELKEDREMLNIALSSKQQELELMKRKFGVAGVAGSTPLGNSRRVSAINNASTPSMGDSVNTNMNTPLIKDINARRTSARLTGAGLMTPAPKHGVRLHPITATVRKDRLLRRTSVPEEEDENKPPASSRLTRERLLA